MLIKKSVISKVKTVNNNLIKLAKRKNVDSKTIIAISNDLAYIVGHVNKIYEDFIAIVSEKIEEKD